MFVQRVARGKIRLNCHNSLKLMKFFSFAQEQHLVMHSRFHGSVDPFGEFNNSEEIKYNQVISFMNSLP